MKVVRLDVWDRDVIFFTWDYGKVLKFVKEEAKDVEKWFNTDYELSRWRTIVTSKWFVICWIKDKKNYWHVAHEIFHCVDLMLRQNGITLSDDSDECYAYTIQYLTQQFYNKNKKQVRL